MMQRDYFLILVAAVFYGGIAVGASFFAGLGFSAFEIAVYTFLAGSFLTAPFVFLKSEYRISRGMLSFFVVFGLIGAFLQLSTFGAIALGVPVAVTVLLLYTEPAWTVFLAKPFLGEAITKRKLLAAGLSLAGVFVVSGAGFDGPVLGVLLALFSGLFLSLWVIFSRKSDLFRQHHVTTAFASMFFPLPWIVLVFPLAVFFLDDPSIVSFSSNLSFLHAAFFLFFALAAFVVPNILFYRGVESVPASRAGIILPLEPVSATFLAVVFFGQPVSLSILVGGGLILAANFFVYQK